MDELRWQKKRRKPVQLVESCFSLSVVINVKKVKERKLEKRKNT